MAKVCEICGKECQGHLGSGYSFPDNLPPADPAPPVPPAAGPTAPRGRRRGEHRAHLAPEPPATP